MKARKELQPLLKKENRSGRNKNMLEQAIDFKIESDDLFQIIKSLTDEELNQKTGFKEWTINNIIGQIGRASCRERV